jgi:hypothetical protein
MITTHNNIFYINILSYNKNNNIYNKNNTIFYLNTLNYKREKIFITHIIILTHVGGRRRVQPQPPFRRGRVQAQLEVQRGRLLAHPGVGRGRVIAQLGCG